MSNIFEQTRLASAKLPTVSRRRDLTFSSTSLALGAAMEGPSQPWHAGHLHWLFEQIKLEQLLVIHPNNIR